MIRALTKKDSEKYAGQYVATRTFLDKKVIVSGKNLLEVHSKAKRITKEPVVFFVPQKNMINIY
jgi:hypothetical protein